MADIRVERGRDSRTWLWVLLAAVIVIIAAVVLLDYLGYIDLPFRLGSGHPQHGALAQLAAFTAMARRRIHHGEG
jgi:hypothetical protein